MASAWSWVTYSVVMPNSSCSRRISKRISSRRLASRFDSGSSSSRNLRLDDQRAGHRHPLLLAARQLARVAVLVAGELHHAQDLGHLALAVGARGPRLKRRP
jgi:hypothetical protein